ncbi:uncharacterized protein LOC118436710 [Folsomia candida]|uniref:uncharacterized protein LOC118436710 n=1 Tax=Folsomia candida TaxID=158441 RepID=UPI0016052B17|nr:uncharacterized protein LOC118436710 [Folsomia candida]
MRKRSAFLTCLYLPLWLLVPPLFLAWLPFHLYRCFVQIVAWLFRRDLTTILTPSDARFSYDRIYSSPITSMVSTLEVEGDVDPNHIRNTWRTQVLEAKVGNRLLYPELGWTIKTFMGHPFWAKSRIVEDRVRFIPEDVTPEQLLELQISLTFQPFKEDEPLWEIIIVRRKYDPTVAPSSIVIFRFHHTMTDGNGVFHMFRKMALPHSTKLGKAETYTIPPAMNRSPARYLGMPYDFVATCREGSRSGCLVEDTKSWTSLGDNFTPSEAASHLRFHICEPIPFSRIRQVGAQHGVTGTAVMHSAILGAVRSSFFPEGTPHSATVMVETNLHPPWRKERPLGNNITKGNYTAPIGELDPLKRLLRTQEALTEMKKSTFPLTRAILFYTLASVPRRVLQEINKRQFGYQRIFIGNLAGPLEKPNFCGYLAKDVFNMTGFYVGYAGLGVVLITLGDSLRLGVFASKNLLPRAGQAEEITRAFVRELDDLQYANQLE